MQDNFEQNILDSDTFKYGLTDEQVEEARVYACNELARRTAKYGKQDSGTVKDLFCSYIFKHF